MDEGGGASDKQFKRSFEKKKELLRFLFLLYMKVIKCKL